MDPKKVVYPLAEFEEDPYSRITPEFVIEFVLQRVNYSAVRALMSNWDLMMPGMGLTSIGLAGVVISYSGIAHTFIDGMHALTGLTMFIGLIFLAAGILQGCIH